MDADEVRNSLAFLFASPPGFQDSAAPPRSIRSVSPAVASPSAARRRPLQALRTHGHLSTNRLQEVKGPSVPPRKIRRLLAIDDSPNLRAFIVQALTAQFPNLIVTLAPDGREGLRLALQDKPDLILLDFVLPDLPGDEVCRQLLADTATADLPVVLMSSSSIAIESTQARYGNVVKSLAKPFTPQLLGDTVGFILREPAPPTVPTENGTVDPNALQRRTQRFAPAVAQLLVGDTGQIPLINVLLAVEQNQWTGTLSLLGEGTAVEIKFSGGRVVISTTRDCVAWWRASVMELDLASETLQAELRSAQSLDGSPPPLQLVPKGTLDLATARQWATETGLRLVANAWTHSRLRFQFTPAVSLPAYCGAIEPFAGSVVEWGMESLRRLGDEFLSAHAWGEPTGLPAYTRKGYERIQTLQLTDEEHAFAECVHPKNSLADIAQRTKTTVADAQRILHRFLCLEILDYWPAALLRHG